MSLRGVLWGLEESLCENVSYRQQGLVAFSR